MDKILCQRKMRSLTKESLYCKTWVLKRIRIRLKPKDKSSIIIIDWVLLIIVKQVSQNNKFSKLSNTNITLNIRDLAVIFFMWSYRWFKKKYKVFILQISWQPSIGFSNSFFLLKTEIHMQILNTNPFLCDFRGPGYLQNKMPLWNRSFQIHVVS